MVLSPKVLLFGGDAELLRIRALVLTRSGFSPLCATTMGEFESLASQQWMDVLLLCHTLPLHQREAAVAFARAQHPSIKVVALHAANALDRGGQTLDAICDIFDGPQHLLTTLQAVACFSQTEPVIAPNLFTPPC